MSEPARSRAPLGPAGAPRRSRGQSGQAAVALVASVPPFLILVAVAVQLAVAGWADWSAANAARAAARAAHIGTDAERAAEAALPPRLAGGLRVGTGRAEGGPGVRLDVPAVVGGLPRLGVRARTDFGPGGGSP